MSVETTLTTAAKGAGDEALIARAIGPDATPTFAPAPGPEPRHRHGVDHGERVPEQRHAVKHDGQK